MRNFNLASLDTWFELPPGTALDLECPENGTRTVQLDLIADSYVSVQVASGERYWLVGAGDGQMSLRFGIAEPSALVVHGDPNATVFVRSHVLTQVIPESIDPSFTSIEPRPAGPSDEMKRLMYMVQLNEERRNRELEQARFDMQASIDALRAESAAPPPADPPAVVDDEAGA